MMTPIKNLLFVLFFSISSYSFASGSSDAFVKRFELIKKEGRVVAIRDNSLSVKFSIKPYLKFIKETLLEEQRLMESKSDYVYEIEEMFAEEFFDKGDRDNTNIRRIVESMEELKKLDIEKIFNNPGFKEVVTKFEGRISDAMEQLDPRIVARLDDPTYYYKRTVGYQAVKWGLDFAKKRLSSVPILNTASHIIVQVEKLIRERRYFHQNMMMHYFENFKESELGMTHEEVNLAWSSVYESRIPWFAFWESSAAKLNWDKHGVNKFFQNVRTANNRFRSHQRNYTRVGSRLNYSFRAATYKDDDVIINMVDSQNQFDSKPAIAYYMQKPERIRRMRIVLQLAELGVSFIPAPDFIKSLATNYFKSFYENQKITEGALFGYFESVGSEEDMLVLRSQYLNPFDKLSL